ncbi:hypothetical protein EBS80_03575 [bacterium]|nr:hypothetical protein [bacterium]
MEPESNIPSEPAAEPVSAVPVEPIDPGLAPKPSLLSSKLLRGTVIGAASVLLLVGTTSFVYLRPPTDAAVRRIVGVVPYPAAVVGNQAISMRAFLDERDALNTYFQTTAAQGGTAPTETEITANIMDTLVHKAAVDQLAVQNGVTVDDARVDEFYAQATSGTDEATFAAQLTQMFGWTPDEFRARVVKPVVLATQLSEKVSADAGRQEARKQKAQAAYDRVAAGEDFAAVAAEQSQDSSAQTGGDIGYVSMSDVPDEWKDDIYALGTGDVSPVVEGQDAFMIFKLTDRTGVGDAEKVQLSLISIPKETLDEVVQDYLATTRVWKLIGRT